MKKYDNYKDSGVEWIGEIPEHWDVKKLKFISKICNGQDQKAVIDDNGIYPIYGSGGIFGKANSFLFDQPSVLLGRKGTIDKPQYVVEPFWTVDTSYYTKIKDGFSTRLFYYLCTTINFELYKYGSAIPSMTQGHLNEIKFSIPNTLDEQTAIANYLDHKTTQIDTLIAKKEQFISLLQEERTAIINQAVTKGLDPKVKMKDSGIEWLGEIPEHWEVTRLGFLSSKIGDGLHGTPNYVDNSDFKFINGNNIGNGQISIYEHTKCVSEDEYIFNKKELNQNSILMSINGTIGNLGFYKGEKVMLGKSVAYINIIDSKALNYTYKYLESESCKTYIDNQLSGSTIKNLSLYSINKIPIPFPSFDEQKEIVDFITIKTNEINILISKSQQEIELLKEYKTALISEVVTGKVDVRDVILN